MVNTLMLLVLIVVVLIALVLRRFAFMVWFTFRFVMFATLPALVILKLPVCI
jgi:uncharacterized protein (DUF58 family)